MFGPEDANNIFPQTLASSPAAGESSTAPSLPPAPPYLRPHESAQTG